MRITEVEPILLRGEASYGAAAEGEEATDNGDWQLLVRVATDAGLTGWADAETLAPAAVAIISGQGMSIPGFQTLAGLLVGEDPRDVQRLWDKMYVGSAYYGRRGIAMQCISAIDNCLWSIRAQAAGQSLGRLLGGRRRDSITAYASTLFRDTPEGVAAAARGYVARGFRAVKFGWGVFGQDEGRDRELVAAARGVLGPERHLLVDPGWYPAGWKNPEHPFSGVLRTRREAERLCRWLAEYDVGWVEDFIHPERFDEYAAVRRSSPVPIAAGEQVATVWDFERFIGEGCVDVVQPDLSRCGGVSVALRVAQMAEQAGTQTLAAMVDRECFTVAPFDGHYEPVVACGETVAAGALVGWLHDFQRIDLDPWPVRAGVDGLVIAQAWGAAVRQGQHIAITGRVLPWVGGTPGE